MKLSLNWAQDYSNVDLKKIDRQTLINKIGEQLGGIDNATEWGLRFDGIVVAKVVACEKHPNADKLSVCLIDDAGVTGKVKRDKNGLVQVVCGAPNVAAGQLVVWIPPGACVPSTYGKDPFVLEARELRGVVSNGMLASASELGISSDHNGILVIDPEEVGSTNAKRGLAFKKLYGLDDLVIDIENKMFTHRPDCFGILGLARELAGITHQAFKSPDWYDENAEIGSDITKLDLVIKNEVPELVKRFCAAVVSDVEVKPSPIFMQSALTRVGIKPINNIVDVTNFVMYLTGQPIHAYDYDKVKGQKTTATLAVRLSKKGEELTLLGGKKLKLGDGAVVIADSTNPIGLGGIMGGAETEVNGTTKNIIIECANFDMNLIRKTSMTYGLFTDASTRFTKGQSSRQNMTVLAYAVAEIKKFAGGKVAGRAIDLKSQKASAKQLNIEDVSFIGDRLGLPGLSLPAVKHLLKNVEFILPASAGKNLRIEVPFWRTDIEIPEDIVEEVGRLYGYDQLPLALPVRAIEPATQNQSLELKNKIRDILAAAGANEVLTYSFVHSSLLESAKQNIRHAYHLRNAISPDLQYFRLSLAPSLLEKVHGNVKQGNKDFAIFEIGSGHNRNLLNDEKLPKQLSTLCFVIVRPKSSGSAYYHAKYYLEYLLNKLHINEFEFSSITNEKKLEYITSAYESKRSAVIASNGASLGIIGEPNSSLAIKLKLPPATALFELDITALLGLVGDPSYEPLSHFPSQDQDFCLKSETSLSYGHLTKFMVEAISSVSGPHGYRFKLAPLDIYQKNPSETKKQTTWRITLWHPDRTLTTVEVNKALDQVAQMAKSKLKAERV